MKPSRREILDEHELLPAPRECQQLFWLRYNRRKRGWRTVHLSDAVAGVVSEAAVRAAQRLDGVTEAWGQVVPAEHAASTRVESFRGGRLVIMVDSASTKYVLARRPLLQSLNEWMLTKEGGRTGVVKQLEFRVGPGRGRRNEYRHEEKRGAGRQL